MLEHQAVRAVLLEAAAADERSYPSASGVTLPLEKKYDYPVLVQLVGYKVSQSSSKHAQRY